MSKLKILLISCMGFALAACSGPATLDGPPEDMADFTMGHNVVIADNAQMSPLSRPATDEEWEATLTAEIEARLGGYEGTRMLHLGTAVVGFALAPPGVPIVASPDSVLLLHVNVWDNATEQKLTDEPKEFIIWEGKDENTFIGSGLTQTREEQMVRLSRNAAYEIQKWLLEHPEWLSDTPEEAENAESGE